MILRHGTFQNFDLIGAANFPHQITQSDADGIGQNRFTVLRDPHKMVLDVVAAVGTRAVVFHPGIVAVQRRT